MARARKLTVRQARNVLNSTLNTVELAKRYGVTPAVIWQIKKRLTYKEIA